MGEILGQLSTAAAQKIAYQNAITVFELARKLQ